MATVRSEKACKKELKYLRKADMPTMDIHEREVSVVLLTELFRKQHFISSCFFLPAKFRLCGRRR